MYKAVVIEKIVALKLLNKQRYIYSSDLSIRTFLSRIFYITPHNLKIMRDGYANK